MVVRFPPEADIQRVPHHCLMTGRAIVSSALAGLIATSGFAQETPGVADEHFGRRGGANTDDSAGQYLTSRA
jgi:hypothetical protein